MMARSVTALVIAITAFAGTLLFCAPAAPAVPAAQEEPGIEVKLGRQRIYEGESVGYEVLLRNVDDPGQPDMSAFTDFDVTFLGSQKRGFSSVSIVNGRLTDNSFHGMSFRYELTPKRSGVLTVPPPLATVDGEVLKGRAQRLEVVTPKKQDLVFLSVSADRKQVYLLQPFTVTLSILVKALPEPYTDQSPVSLRDFPALRIPWADEREGLQTESASEWLTPLLNRNEGFSINGFTNQRDIFFALHDRSPKARFRPPLKRVMRPDGSGREAEYYEYTLSRRFEPVDVGDYSFGPVTLKGGLPRGVDSRRRPLMEDVYALSGSVAVSVTDAPLEGRPEFYTGAVGDFRLTADLQPRVARVGDPVTLTLTLKGSGTLDRAFAPDLAAFPGVADNFRIYEATEETKGSRRTFTYSIRPLNAEITAFPSVALACFDVERERYVTLRTESIALAVEDAEILAEGDIVSGGGRAAPAIKILGEREGIFADVIDPARLRNQRVRPERWALLIGGMFLFYCLASLGARTIRKRYGDAAAQRRRTAAGRARVRLKAARSLLTKQGGATGGGATEGVDCMRGALAGFVGDVAGVPSEGMTHRDLHERLLSAGVSERASGRLARIHEDCDALRYGVSEGSGEIAGEALGAFEDAVKELRKAGRLR
jgi:hypothetical protein